ncbi:ribonuclease HII [Medusavirus stheno T3]|uniref:Ribonuclease H2 subunit A n=1 Tax=Medusavirus stheno T3 TaxID=3069717 RepID=A0A7S8BDE8_9VIRU|nr:ribonuclease HII [Acanthamoeba castellanii medusavirus]QPB44391.1 ribonuclease HII [Medusavirus stheno T3]
METEQAWNDYDVLRGKRKERSEGDDTPAKKKLHGVACCLGIDEAGRGPVIGPMVYACAYCPVEDQQSFRSKGYNDSKQVKPAARERLFKALVEEPNLGFKSRIISAEEISNGSFRRPEPYNLNQISYDAAMELVQRVLDEGVNVTHLYVDTVGDDVKYQAMLARRFPKIDSITVESKADATYPIVSVASIVAKVLRDGVTEALPIPELGDGPIDRRYGNGYPGSKDAKDWMRRHFDPLFGWPSIVRFNWSTCDVMLGELRGHAVTWEHAVATGKKKTTPPPEKRCGDARPAIVTPNDF